MCTMIHVCNQIGINSRFVNDKKTVETTFLDAEIAKGEYIQVSISKKKGQEQQGGVHQSKS